MDEAAERDVRQRLDAMPARDAICWWSRHSESATPALAEMVSRILGRADAAGLDVGAMLSSASAATFPPVSGAPI